MIDLEKYNKLIPNKLASLSKQIEKAKYMAGLEAFYKPLPAGLGPYFFVEATKEAAYTAYYRADDNANEKEIIMLLSPDNKIIVILRNRLTGNAIDIATVSHQNEFLTLEESWSKKHWS